MCYPFKGVTFRLFTNRYRTWSFVPVYSKNIGECMVTIRDVAKKANCSISTASYALSGSRKISEATTRRVLDAAMEIGYYPSNAARALKKGKSYTVCVFAVEYLSPMLSPLLAVMSGRFLSNGYNMVTTTCYDTVCKMLHERSIDGLIVFDTAYGKELIENRKSMDIPICFLNNRVDGERIFNCVQDNENLFYSIVDYLVSKGCRRVAYLSGPPDSFDNQQRYKGYLRACGQHTVSPINLTGDFTIRSGYLTGKRIIASGEWYDAIACGNDEMAIGVMEAFREHGLSAPRDIRITGYDDIEFSRYYSPNITTVSIDRDVWGEWISNSMIASMNGVSVESNIYIKGSIVIRESA